MKFYLIVPGDTDADTDSGRPHNFYWVEDKGEHWLHFLKGVWHPKHTEDTVIECSLADDITELDWSKTPLHNDTLTSGWLCRSGRFYGCPSYFHDKLAAYVLGAKVPDLEKTGWVRVYDKNRYTCDHRLSEEQKNWLSENGYKIHERW